MIKSEQIRFSILFVLLAGIQGCFKNTYIADVDQNSDYPRSINHSEGGRQCVPARLDSSQLDVLEKSILRFDMGLPSGLVGELCAHGPVGTHPRTLKNPHFYATMIWNTEVSSGFSRIVHRSECLLLSECTDPRLYVEWPENVSFPIDTTVDVNHLELIRHSLEGRTDLKKKIFLIADGEVLSKKRGDPRLSASYRIYAFGEGLRSVEHAISKSCIEAAKVCPIERPNPPSLNLTHHRER